MAKKTKWEDEYDFEESKIKERLDVCVTVRKKN